MILNGLRYHLEIRGSGPALLLLHGFTGSTETWGDMIPALAEHHHVIVTDLPGHGRTDSPVDPERYRIEHIISDLLTLLDELTITRITVLGYSMGGRVALHLATTAPDRVERLILESTSPGIDDPDERAERVHRDEVLADRIEGEGLESFVAYWEHIPLFASQHGLPNAARERLRRQRLRSNPIGLANSLRGFGAGVPDPLWNRLPALPETLLIAGELDTKYVAIARRMADLIPQSHLAIIPDAGHIVHLEQPDRFARVVMGGDRSISGDGQTPLALDDSTAEDIRSVGAGRPSGRRRVYPCARHAQG